MELISWLGSFLLAICGLPLVIDAYRSKKCEVSTSFLFIWGLGEVLVAIYTIYKNENALSFNYISNIIFISILFYYKYNTKEVL